MDKGKTLRRRICTFGLSAVLLLTGRTPVPAAAPDTKNDTEAAVEAPVSGSVKAASGTADPGTMDSYEGAMLDTESGNRYAGRVWSDKTVFAYGAAQDAGGLEGNTLTLDEETDGYEGSLAFDADFLNVYSTMASSQVLYDSVSSPFDWVIVLDMSGSMAQSTKYPIEAEKSEGYEETMEERIENSRIQKTLDAVNETIDSFMAQNRQNRIAVCVYGANAAVLMPLAHYRKIGDEPYLTIGGMETLYERSDFSTVEELEQENPGMTFDEGIWNINRDACYTVVANAYYDTGNEAPDTFTEIWNRTISNNVKSDLLHPDPDLDGDGRQLPADQYVGYMTNTQGGIYLGMKQLADTKERTYTGTLEDGEKTVFARIPAVMVLTDGGANFAFNSPAEDGEHELPGNTGDEWYDIYLPEGDITDLYNDGIGESRLTSIPAYDDGGIFYDSDADVGGTPSTILEVLMTASYMKNVVEKHYEQGWERDHASEESRIPLSIYTVSVDAVHLPAWGRYRIYPTMNPEVYFNGTRWNDSNYECIGNDFRSPLPWRSERDNHMVDLLPYTYSKWEEWTALSSPGETVSLLADWRGNPLSSGPESIQLNTIANQTVPGCATLRIGRLPEGHFYARENENGRVVERIRVTNQEVIDEIFYPDEFYDVESEDLRNVFQDIVDRLRGEAFLPVSGRNGAGAEDSVTYRDLLAPYMEVQNGSITLPAPEDGSVQNADMAALLFGEMHGLTREAVCDPAFNAAYMAGPGQAEEGFPEGWYRGDSGNTAEYCAPGEAPEDPWNSGWTYRISEQELISRIPTLRKAGGLSGEQEDTVYTLYGFAGEEEESDRLRINPVYGSIVPSNVRSEWEALEEKPAGNDLYKDEAGVYRLNDISVWTEHVPGSSETEDEKEIDGTDSLYVDIPVSALPTQAAWVALGLDGPEAFESNLEEKAQATPFRLFYTVGLDQGLINEDTDGERIVDIEDLPQEYLKTHRGDYFGSIYFLSGDYSGSFREGDPEAVCQVGDATVTFSPSGDNPYYLYQEPMPLYRCAYRVNDENGLVSVEELDSWPGGAMWPGGAYMGMYRDEEAYASARGALVSVEGTDMIRDSSGDLYPFAEGGIVLLETDLFTVDSAVSGQEPAFREDGCYFFADEYYVPDGEDTQESHAVRTVSCITSSGLGAGTDMSGAVCWADLSGSAAATADYAAAAEDSTRGVPTVEKLTYSGQRLRAYLRGIGISGEEIEGQAAYWQDIQGQLLSRMDLDEDEEISAQEYEEAGYRWVLSIKPGVRRSGELYRSVSAKEANPSETAENVSAYAVSAAAESAAVSAVDAEAVDAGEITESDADSTADAGDGQKEVYIVFGYLGNNGRLVIDNPLLYVTNRITVSEEAADGTEFRYQIYIDGFSGEQDAVVLSYNPFMNEGEGGWQQQIAELDLRTNEAGLVLDAGGRTAVVDKNGNYVGEESVSAEEEYYHVYLAPDGAGDGLRRIYIHEEAEGYDPGSPLSGMGCCMYVQGELPENEADSDGYWRTYRPADQDAPSGTMDFYCKDAWLIPVNETRNEEPVEGDTAWKFNPGDTGSYIHLGYGNGTDAPDYEEGVSPFVVARMEPVSADSSASITSDYLITSTLLTRTLYFGTREQEGEREEPRRSAMTAGDLLDDTPFWPGETTCAAIPGQQRAVMETEEYARAAEGDREVTWITWEEVASHTADLTLRDGEGLMLTIRPELGYRVTEDGKNSEGFLLSEASRESGSGAISYTINDMNTPCGSQVISAWNSIEENGRSIHRSCGRFPDGPDEYQGSRAVRHWNVYDTLQMDYSSSGQTELVSRTRFVTGENGSRTYTLYGNAAGDREGIHYINEYRPSALVVENWLETTGGNVNLSREDMQQEFTYTLSLEDRESGEPVDADLEYVITGFKDNETAVISQGALLSQNTGGNEETDIAAGKAGVWRFVLKGGQQMAVSGLPSECSYTVTQDAVSGFLESGIPGGTKGRDQDVTVSGTAGDDGKSPEIAVFTNRKTVRTLLTADGEINFVLWIILATALVLDLFSVVLVYTKRRKR